jgi:transposase
MSMRPVPWPEPDPVVEAAIRAKYAGRKTRVPLAVTIRDRLGQWLEDERFAAAFGTRGRPGWPPSRLALVTVLQMRENLADRDAAEAVRTRLDWQYLLGLRLDDPGFDHSVLSEFRSRAAAHGLEEVVLDALLDKLAAEGLVKAGGKQRTDSTHVIAAVRKLRTVELAGESVRAALEALAAACPDWLAGRICVPDWTRRYGARIDSWRLPSGKAARDALTIEYARDGYALVRACYQDSAPGWAREIPAVQILRTVLLQNFTLSVSDQGQEVIRRREPEAPRISGDGIPPGHLKIASPYDPGARWGVKKDLHWLGYKLHITETCDDPPDCGCPPDPPAAGRCRHDTRPNLVTHVATTSATVPDTAMTLPAVTALAARNLAPARHYLDAGYASARNMAEAARLSGTILVTPLTADPSPQARAQAGYDQTAFTIDYQARTVTCPQGTTSHRWTPARSGSRDLIKVQFPPQACRACPARSHCTTAAPSRGRQLNLPPPELHDLITAARTAQAGKPWQHDYKRRAGIEATISHATALTRRTRYRAQPAIRLAHIYTATALNLDRLDAYWNDTPIQRERTTHLTRLDHALKHAA